MVIRQGERRISHSLQPRDPARHLCPQGPPGRPQHQLLLVTYRQRIGDEPESLDMTDVVTLDHDLAPQRHRGQQFLAVSLLQPPHQMR